MQIHVGLITWGPDHGDIDEYITVGYTEEQVKQALAMELIIMRDQTNGLFDADDLDRFYQEDWVEETHTQFRAHDTVDQIDVDRYLNEFREATTAPWWSVQEVELSA